MSRNPVFNRIIEERTAHSKKRLQTLTQYGLDGILEIRSATTYISRENTVCRPYIEEENMEKLVIDTASGEIIDELFEGDRIVRRASDAYRNRITKLNEGEAYVKFYLLAADALSRVGGIHESGYKVCLRLLQYIRYDTGLIAHENGNPMNLECIKDVFGELNERTTENALDELVKQGIFARVKRGREVFFLVNPYIFMRGVTVNRTLKKVFKESMWAELYIEE